MIRVENFMFSPSVESRVYPLVYPHKTEYAPRLAMTLRRFVLLLMLCAASTSVQAQSKPYWMLWGETSKNKILLGSEDPRRGGGCAVQYVTPWSRLRFKHIEGLLCWEAYYTKTAGGDNDGAPVDHSHAYGLMASARYERPLYGNFKFYTEVGWGLQYVNIETIDLSAKLNSTPTIGLGLIFPVGKDQLYAGWRWQHVSNAGTSGNNQGQNQFQLRIGWKF